MRGKRSRCNTWNPGLEHLSKHSVFMQSTVLESCAGCELLDTKEPRAHCPRFINSLLAQLIDCLKLIVSSCSNHNFHISSRGSTITHGMERKLRLSDSPVRELDVHSERELTGKCNSDIEIIQTENSSLILSPSPKTTRSM